MFNDQYEDDFEYYDENEGTRKQVNQQELDQVVNDYKRILDNTSDGPRSTASSESFKSQQ